VGRGLYGLGLLGRWVGLAGMSIAPAFGGDETPLAQSDDP
jgi:hypothetical protein